MGHFFHSFQCIQEFRFKQLRGAHNNLLGDELTFSFSARNSIFSSNTWPGGPEKKKNVKEKHKTKRPLKHRSSIPWLISACQEAPRGISRPGIVVRAELTRRPQLSYFTWSWSSLKHALYSRICSRNLENLKQIAIKSRIISFFIWWKM